MMPQSGVSWKDEYDTEESSVTPGAGNAVGFKLRVTIPHQMIGEHSPQGDMMPSSGAMLAPGEGAMQLLPFSLSVDPETTGSAVAQLASAAATRMAEIRRIFKVFLIIAHSPAR